MPATKPRILLRIEYEKAARRYLESLPLEHFMEGTPQATQRKITLESFDLIAADRPDFHVFNELLVQYPTRDSERPIGQVVPDNMVVLHDGPIEAVGSYDTVIEEGKPYLMLEYVSKGSERKDYEDNMQKYERDLKVPYYLLFYPDNQELTLFRHNGRKYISVKANDAGRLPIDRIDLEAAIMDGWVRYWYLGKLLPLPAELLNDNRALARDNREMASEIERLRAQIESMKRAS